MTLTKEQAQWLMGAIDLRVKNEGLNGAGFGLSIAAAIQAEQQEVMPETSNEENQDSVN